MFKSTTVTMLAGQWYVLESASKHSKVNWKPN